MHEALIEELGVEHVAFIRLRRSRIETMKSQARTTIRFRLMNYPGALLRVSNETWEGMPYEEQLLWAIDELEARWQRLVSLYPRVHALEVNWDKHISPQMFREVASSLRCPSAEFGHQHNHDRKPVDVSRLLMIDAIYKRRMGFTEEQKWAIRLARF